MKESSLTVKDEMGEDQGAAVPLVSPRHSMSEWASFLNQAVATVVASSSSSRTIGQDVVKMIESAKRLGAQEFKGTIDPAQAEFWLRRMERV